MHSRGSGHAGCGCCCPDLLCCSQASRQLALPHYRFHVSASLAITAAAGQLRAYHLCECCCMWGMGCCVLQWHWQHVRSIILTQDLMLLLSCRRQEVAGWQGHCVILVGCRKLSRPSKPALDLHLTCMCRVVHSPRTLCYKNAV